MKTLTHPLQRWPRSHYIENLGLDISLWGHPASPWPEISRVAALLKFGAIGLALAYGLSGIIAVAIGRTRKPQANEGG